MAEFENPWPFIYQYGADYLLLSFMFNNSAFQALLAEGQVVPPVRIPPSSSKRYFETYESVPNSCFGGRELGGNLPK